jgi:hypothetical protein
MHGAPIDFFGYFDLNLKRLKKMIITHIGYATSVRYVERQDKVPVV